MQVFHGTTLKGACELVNNPVAHSFPGLWVTDTAERAARYANARVTKTVDFHATELSTHGAVVVIDVDSPSWSRRENNYDEMTATSLDACEALVKYKSELKIVEVRVTECDKPHCGCHMQSAFAKGESQEFPKVFSYAM